MRAFEKISFDQFKKDISTDEKLYHDYLIPKRATTNSAGYDFYALNDYVIKPGKSVLIATGVKARMQKDEVLLLIIRSSMGFKYNLRLVNQVGVIDADYYNNSENEGHIFVKLKNEGDLEYNLKRNEKYLQGIFIKFLKVDDDNIANVRKGGLGSTSKGD